MTEEQNELTLTSGYMAPVAEQMAKMLVGTVLDYQELLVLYDCARTTVHALAIRRSIERGADMPTEEELMLERFRNIDITMNR